MMSNATLISEDQAGSSPPADSERLVKVKSSHKVASPTEDPGLLEREAPEEQRARRKTRRLSQVETPEALKKATRKRKATAPEVGGRDGGKMKRLSEVKTPEGFKNGNKKRTKKATATVTAAAVKRKSLKRASSSKPAKKGRK
ncbi:uncharacterized protein LOC104456722 [Eucalyptus grandis]|uniref:Uncharacterized protein n=2 Tax=Eucalyptus grandis TaxID=71139 RepID=A0ACC3JMF5_EUCGR|nr:uncharacterized protein LOC104456722 [Eucalyptus grandis]KAK3415445.1 hypothetical protein EUGRSUZ_H01073 [Eucalyptus grandis]